MSDPVLSLPALLHDVETYRNFWMVGFMDLETGIVSQFSTETDIGGTLDELREWFAMDRHNYLFVGFNSLAYDNSMLYEVLVRGEDDPLKLFAASQRIIALPRNRVESVDGEASLDLFAMLGGQNAKLGSLKECAVKIGYRQLRELPHHWNSVLTHEQMVEVAAYNRVDLAVTAGVTRLVRGEIEARLALSEQYYISVWNSHDAALAARILARELFGLASPIYPNETSWAIAGHTLVAGFNFRHPELAALRQRISGWHLTWDKVDVKDEATGEWYKKIQGETFSDAVKVGDTSFTIGVGGLHSVDEAGIWEADQDYRIVDFDVDSYYPSIIVNYGLAPSHLDRAAFVAAYDKLRKRRLEAKEAGHDALSNGMKVSVNSIFGKTKEPYSWLLDPPMLTQITVKGQLILLSLVDLIADIDGIEVVSANTDGLTLKLRRDLADEVIAAIRALAAQLNFTLTQVEYLKLARRDISNYIAVTEIKGVVKVKAKGAYAYDRAALGKKAVNRVVVDAVQRFFVDGTSPEVTIRACRVIDDFLDFFKANRAYTIQDDQGGEYGGIARWYLSVNGVHLDKKKLADGKLFQLVEAGARVVMDLPETFPDDVDYAMYVAKAEKLIQAITNPEIKFSHTIPLAELNSQQRAKLYHNQTESVVDQAKLDGLNLDSYHKAFAEKVKGNSYDTMKHLLVRAWMGAGGDLTVAELRRIALAIDDVGGGRMARREIDNMVGWIGREVSPFPLPRTAGEHIARAMVWASDTVEKAKVKRKMWHNGVLDSRYLSGEALRKYARTRNTYPLACHICAASAKHDKTQDAIFLTGVLQGAVDYFAEPI